MSTPARARSLLLVAAVLVSVGSYHAIRLAFADELDDPNWIKGLPQQHKSKWLVHDPRRPQPVKVAPGDAPGAPPSDAIVLFDGTDLSKWDGNWKVENGYMEVNGTGSISTKDVFSDFQLHLEYMAPNPPQKSSQARGNSGILIMDTQNAADPSERQSGYEIQVLDSWENRTYPDGFIGSVYGQHPPLVNPCRKPGEWQTYDIIFKAPRFESKKLVEPGHVTVLLNGVVVQHNAEIYGSVRWRGKAEYKAHGPGRITLQDHGDKQNPRFRNIWVRKLDLSPEAIDHRK